MVGHKNITESLMGESGYINPPLPPPVIHNDRSLVWAFMQLTSSHLLFYVVKCCVPVSIIQVHTKVEKSHSEPMFPPVNDPAKPSDKPPAGHVHSSTDTRKLSVQSSASTGGSGERKPRRTSRGTHQGASLNEVKFTGINVKIRETAHLPLPLPNINRKFDCCWVMGRVGA